MNRLRLCLMVVVISLFVPRRLRSNCPSHFNPADFYVHTVAIVPGREVECRKFVQVGTFIGFTDKLVIWPLYFHQIYGDAKLA